VPRVARVGRVSDPYDDDILRWLVHQAALLRRCAAGELVNDAEIGWTNVAEEIKDVGRQSADAVASLLAQALRHMLKAEAWPSHRDAPSWRADAIDVRQQAKRRFAESMEGQQPLPVPAQCSVTLDELLIE
jgi:uncharacterized protein DUF29